MFAKTSGGLRQVRSNAWLLFLYTQPSRLIVHKYDLCDQALNSGVPQDVPHQHQNDPWKRPTGGYIVLTSNVTVKPEFSLNAETDEKALAKFMPAQHEQPGCGGIIGHARQGTANSRSGNFLFIVRHVAQRGKPLLLPWIFFFVVL